MELSVCHKAFMVLVLAGFPKDSAQKLLGISIQDARQYVADIKQELGVDLATGGKRPVPDILKAKWDKDVRVGKAELDEMYRELGKSWVQHQTRFSKKTSMEADERKAQERSALELMYHAYRVWVLDGREAITIVEERMRTLNKARLTDGAGSEAPWSGPNG